MIICIDVGNSNIKYAVFDGDEPRFTFRVATDLKKTSDEYGTQLFTMLEINAVKREEITGGIISSVVPSLDYTLCHMLKVYFGVEPKQIAPGLRTGLRMRADNAREVGADRIVNNVSALRKYGAEQPIIIVDFGTATTFNILKDGEFIGGVIAPGIKGSLDSLISGTAKLPRVEIAAPKSVIATNTVTNIQAGVELGCNALTVATGGLAEVIAHETDCIDVIDKMLTLNGLKYLYDMNSSEEGR